MMSHMDERKSLIKHIDELGFEASRISNEFLASILSNYSETHDVAMDEGELTDIVERPFERMDIDNEILKDLADFMEKEIESHYDQMRQMSITP